MAHTTAVAHNRFLLVSVGMNNRNATGTTVASVTYGGTPLTKLNAVSDAELVTRTEVWYLLTPPTGANNVVMPTSTGCSGNRRPSWTRSGASRSCIASSSSSTRR